MDFELTDEQQLIRDAVREFAEAEVTPIAAELDRDHRFPTELLPRLAEMNLMGMPYPEKEGGAGADYVSYVIAVEELSRACASTGVILSAHTSLATWPVFKFGTEAQQDRYLHDMASGRRLGAFALTEPAAGTDAGTPGNHCGDNMQELEVMVRKAGFSTLAAICQFLECQPGDILEYREEAVENAPRDVASDAPTPIQAEPIRIPTMKTSVPPTMT